MKYLIFIIIIIVTIFGVWAGHTINSQRFTITNYQRIFQEQADDINALVKENDSLKADYNYLIKMCDFK